MKKESFLEKISAHFIAINGIAMMFFYIYLWDTEKMPFEDCMLLCILFGVGSIINTILITGERIIKKINELNEQCYQWLTQMVVVSTEYHEAKE